MQHPELTSPMISRAMEDYLKTIHRLTTGKDKVSTSRLAQRMRCSAASVTNMLQRLSDLKLVNYEPYQGVTLTTAGTKIALETIRHHRLIELYLADVLGYSWDKVHDEAEELEHVISEEFEERIDKALGHPTLDPHGAPIPSKDGEVENQRFHSLWDAQDGESVKVGRVRDRSPEVLRYLGSIGIFPDVKISVIRRDPFSGPIHIELGDTEHTLSEELARQIFVVPA